MSIVEKLTEGIINRDLSKEGAALISKWEKTGLLEGLEGDNLVTEWHLCLKIKPKSYSVRTLRWKRVALKALRPLRSLSFVVCSAI